MDVIGLISCTDSPVDDPMDRAASLQQQFVLQGCSLINNCVQETITWVNPNAHPQVCGQDYNATVHVAPFTGYSNCPCP